ncbi:MAG: VanZ family protein [Butyricicoccus sp.]
MMKQRAADWKPMTIFLFCIYFAVLTWIIVFKMALPGESLPHFRSVNWIPFGDSMIINDRISYEEIIQNILAFVPFGIYLSMLFPERSLIYKLLPASVCSLGYEILQFVCAIGASDITDWLGNSFGALIGMGVYTVFYHVFGKYTNRIFNICAAIATMGMSLLIVILIVSN